MNINKAIRELHEEKKRLDHVIASLEAVLANPALQTVELPGKKRGRKFMDEQARKEVSERMKHYWAARRNKRATAELSAEQPNV